MKEQTIRELYESASNMYTIILHAELGPDCDHIASANARLGKAVGRMFNDNLMAAGHESTVEFERESASTKATGGEG